MKSRHRSINIFFALVCLVLAAGCASTSKKKEQTTIRLYIEGQRANKSTGGTVLVTKDRIPFTVEREQFLDEGDLSKASIVEDPDGTFSIQLVFNDHGTLVLDMYTSSNKGRHVIVFSQFPIPGKKAAKAKKKSEEADDSDLVEAPNGPEPVAGKTRDSAWLAAVLIKDRISNGTFRFTPDATRKETNRIVRGLRNVIAEAKKHEN